MFLLYYDVLNKKQYDAINKDCTVQIFGKRSKFTKSNSRTADRSRVRVRGDSNSETKKN